MADSLQRSYWCFISYSHADNKAVGREWATWLHQQLETYEVPSDLVGTPNANGESIPARIFPVFRDEEELEPGDLSLKLYRAMDHARVMIVICSPRAFQSHYVSDEIRYFKRIGKGDRIYAAIVDGEPSDRGERASFPRPLCFEVDSQGKIIEDRRVEPAAADFRLNDDSQGWTNPEAYREELADADLSRAEIARRVASHEKRLQASRLKLIASVLGVPFGALQKRDSAYQLALSRRRTTILRRWLSAVASLALVAAGTAFYANVKRREAVRAALIATSRTRALQSSTVLPAQPDLALLYAADAYQTFDTYEARFALLSAITSRSRLRRIAHTGRGPISAVAVSHDGAVVASGYKDGTVRFWSASTLDPIEPVLKAHDGSLAGISMSPATGILATAAGEEIRLWSLSSRQPLRDPLRTDLGTVSKIQFSPDGSYLASAHESGITLWRVPSFERIVPRFEDSENASCIAISADNALLAAGDYGARVRVWNTATRQFVAEPVVTHQRFVVSVAFSPDGEQLAVGGSSPGVSVFNPRTMESIGTVSTANGALVSFEKTSRMFAAADRAGNLALWSLRYVFPGNAAADILTAHRGGITAFAFDPKSEFMITGGEDGRLIKWSVDVANALGRSIRQDAIAIARTRKEPLLAIARRDGPIMLWDPSRNSFPRSIQGVPAESARIAISPDDQSLAALYPTKVMIWNLEDGRLTNSYEHGLDAGYVVLFAFDRNGRIVTRSAPASGEREAVAISDDGALSAEVRAGNVTVTQLETNTPVRRFPVSSEVDHILFSPDRSRLALLLDNDDILIHDLDANTSLKELRSRDDFDARVLAFSPDNRLLAVTGEIRARSLITRDGLFLWDLTASQPIGELFGDSDLASSTLVDVEFSSDSKTLMTRTDDGLARSWEVSPEAWRSTALHIANRALAPFEK